MNTTPVLKYGTTSPILSLAMSSTAAKTPGMEQEASDAE